MKTTVAKWGNSIAIRLPKPIVDQAGLIEKDDIDIEVLKGTIVLTPRTRRAYRLDDLLKEITPQNIHPEVDFGEPIGREAL